MCNVVFTVWSTVIVSLRHFILILLVSVLEGLYAHTGLYNKSNTYTVMF